MENVQWDTLKLIIFDVDGTLYDQSKLRKKMFIALIKYYFFRPWRYKDLLILYHFRKEREKKAGIKIENLQQAQYEWCLMKVKSSLKRIKEVTDKWIFDFPTRYLQECMYPGVKSFFEELEKKGILKAIYSDYEAKVKLEKMGIRADLVLSSTDAVVNALKPLPDGLNYIVSEMKINNKTDCLFIGDREELDGECSRAADIPFLLVGKEKKHNNFYTRLTEEVRRSSI